MLPPVAAAVAAPLATPLQVTFEVDRIDPCSNAGFIIFTFFNAVHAFISVTVTTYEPAARPVAIAVFCPFDHK